MQDRRVARRYAQALFTLALKNDMVKAVEEDLAGIANLLTNDAQFKDFLLSPYASREEKHQIAGKLFSDRITGLTMQALRLMLTKGRETELLALRDEYVILRRINEGVVFATVSSAEAMPQEQQTKITSKLAQVTGRVIEAHFEIDPRLIGGVKVTYENTVLDGSLRGALNRLRDHLRHDVLKQG